MHYLCIFCKFTYLSRYPVIKSCTYGNKKITFTYRMVCRITSVYSDVSKI